jgi:hypothetical protein
MRVLKVLTSCFSVCHFAGGSQNNFPVGKTGFSHFYPLVSLLCVISLRRIIPHQTRFYPPDNHPQLTDRVNTIETITGVDGLLSRFWSITPLSHLFPLSFVIRNTPWLGKSDPSNFQHLSLPRLTRRDSVRRVHFDTSSKIPTTMQPWSLMVCCSVKLGRITRLISWFWSSVSGNKTE